MDFARMMSLLMHVPFTVGRRRQSDACNGRALKVHHVCMSTRERGKELNLLPIYRTLCTAGGRSEEKLLSAVTDAELAELT